MAAREPVKIRGRRSAGDVLAGVAATVLLAALVVGVPVLLLAVFGSPLPDRPPALDDFTQQIGPSTLLTILAALVWLAWLQLLVCVAVEVHAGIRGIGVPARVPLAGGTQSLVHRLVVTALLLFTATTAIVPAFAAGRGLQPAQAVATEAPQFRQMAATAPAETPPPAAADLPTEQPTQKALTTKIYRVQPPEGRHHESLWEIAEKCLGDGRRYKEIYALNKGREQPDGSKLSIASLIRPGWILEMPADAANARVVPVDDLDEYFQYGKAKPDPAPEPPVQAPPAEEPPSAQPAPPAEPPSAQPTPPAEPPATQPAEPPSAQPAPAPPPTRATPTKPAQPTRPPAEPPSAQPVPPPARATPTEPGAAAPAPKPSAERPAERPAETSRPRTPTELGGEAGTGGAQVPGGGQPSERPEQPAADVDLVPVDIGWPQSLAAGALLAAGLLAALGRRRREQRWHRGFGEMIARPEGAAAAAEQALRIGSDEDAVRLLDLGLRQLSQSLAADDRTLPTVYGVHLGAESLDLWIAPADRHPPAPWEAHDDGQVWRLHATALPELEAADLGEVLAPYPGLVSIGTNDTGRILVDLEAAHGLIALRGPADTRRAVLAAVALELATNRWSDHMRITLVGFGSELVQVAPDRIRAVHTLADALPELEGRTEEVRQALAASGADSVLTGRCRGVFGEAWMPHYLIMADEPTPDEAARLGALARTGRRMAAGYLVPGDVSSAAWTWEVTPEGALHAGVLGFDVEAQLIPDEQYRAVVDLFHTAGRLDAAALPDPRAALGDEPPAAVDDRPAADIRLLGSVEVDAPGPMDDSRRPLCTEVLVYLAAHPGGVHPTVLGGAVWPRGVTAGVRDATIARVSDWLGRDSRGRPNLYYDERGRIRLGSEVRIDWSVFRWLVWRSAAEPDSEAAYMAYALDLVRGPLLADRPRGRYGWLAADDLEYEATARVIDVSHRLVLIRLDDGDARGAVEAARAGLRLVPDEEVLWRDLLRATHAAGDLTQVEVVADELRAYLGHDPLLDQIQPETEALIEELLPRHRIPAHGI
ncbi:hypothetical protein DPM19_25900 [Actinomadura craniellae]|uniref:Bacterial transcriptional activator domain-containing protein n=1 Tax=Actinomadura craniellae TaxID=2231787 RepID=A0A365GZB2_9ACTN|nr:bacterial transcriptional activator domain-containing protein [Actinomadura craniellae]RAY12161.1 hypothetical protein DPM19_25900 [Actinomadura craniellae]